jgi:hypothetical protein
MKPRAFGYRRHPSGIYAERSFAPSVRQRVGAALHYEAPPETGTEMLFDDDIDSPEVLAWNRHTVALGPRFNVEPRDSDLPDRRHRRAARARLR